MKASTSPNLLQPNAATEFCDHSQNPGLISRINLMPRRLPRRHHAKKETTMSLKWIAASLAMGTWIYVANCLCQASTV
jgi:hypothetical protein